MIARGPLTLARGSATSGAMWARALLLCALCAPFSAGCGPSAASVREREKDAEIHYQLAYGNYIDTRKPNVDAAMQQVLAALRLRPDYPEAHMLAGLIFMGREMYLDAEKHFRRAAELKPAYHGARNNLGTVYLATGRWDDAIAIYDALVADQTYATPGAGQNNLGWAYYSKGDLDTAKRHFRLAIQLSPALCLAYNNLGMVLFEQDQLREAQRTLETATRRCPNYAEPFYHLGRVAARLSDLTGARDRFGKCATLAAGAPLADRCEQRLAALPPQEGR
ncbi:MAG: tetratricopeptide repeat protein [Myxococcales bacterium]|nr:tetratricopeptide repeat protein [Myxococcales bacterium]